MAYPNVEGLLTGTKPVNDREPLIGLEQGTGIILELTTFQHPEKGFSARARILVCESKGPEAHAPGSIVCALWFLERRPKFNSQTSDADRFADFVMKTCDCTDPQKVQQWGGALLVHRIGEQLLRGMFVKFEGRNVAKAGKPPYVVPSWMNVPQSPEQIAQTRAKIDQTHPIQPQIQQQVMQQPQVAYPNAPHAAMQPQYAPQQPQYQQQPQQPAPQYQQQPVYAQPPQQPAAQPQTQMQPQGAPPPGYPMPPGYGR